MSDNNGKFNLDYEESVLLRGRVGNLTKKLKKIKELAEYLLNKKSYMSEHEKDMVKEIRDRTED